MAKMFKLDRKTDFTSKALKKYYTDTCKDYEIPESLSNSLNKICEDMSKVKNSLYKESDF